MKVLQLETGTRCNNRCVFCYQRDYRCAGAAPPEPSTAALRERLAYGRREGYEGVGFTGGEPTVREDFVALVVHAHELGYQRISLTTNGRRLADPAYRAALLDAGLNGVGWSVHGATAVTHDRLTGQPGAFAALRAAIAGLGADANATGRRLDQNLFTVVNRTNHEELPAMAREFRALGVRLFILQPLVYSRGNLGDMAALSLPLPQVLTAVERVVEESWRHDFRVKPFNLPPCLFAPGAVEHERHRLSTFRSHERGRPGESRLPTPAGFFRAPACDDCAIVARCPGLPLSLLPQAQLFAALRPAATVAGDERWLAGLELAEADTIARLVEEARGHGARRVVLCLGGDSVLDDALPAALAAARPDAVRYVLHRREPRSGDLRRATRGNLERILAGLHALASHPGATGIVREVGVLLERSERTAQAEELAALVQAGAQRLHLEVAPGDPELATRLNDALRLVMGPLRPLPWARRARISLDLADSAAAIPAWQRRAARAVVRVEEVGDRLQHTVPTGPSFGWVTDSVPIVAQPGEHRDPWAWPASARGPLVAAVDGLRPIRSKGADRA